MNRRPILGPLRKDTARQNVNVIFATDYDHTCSLRCNPPLSRCYNFILISDIYRTRMQLQKLVRPLRTLQYITVDPQSVEIHENSVALMITIVSLMILQTAVSCIANFDSRN